MSQHFRVVIRCRPSSEEKAWKVDERSLRLSGSGEPETFSFGMVLTESESHAQLYEKAVSPLVASALDEGRNAFVVAYGQPRSGKTHAAFGSLGMGTSRTQTEKYGVIARMGQQVFDAISSDWACRVSATFCHVFEDGRVADLLDSRRRRLEVVEDHSSNTYSISSLTEHPIHSPLDLVRLAEKAYLMRNASGCRKDLVQSSMKTTPRVAPFQPEYKAHCSHAIFSLKVERCKKESNNHATMRDSEEEEEHKDVILAQITVVDLAGHSIELVHASQPCPDSGIEMLHQVLSTLPVKGIVATASLIRQSTLTKLLKPALGGNADTLIIGTLSLSEEAVDGSKRCLQVCLLYMHKLY